MIFLTFLRLLPIKSLYREERQDCLLTNRDREMLGHEKRKAEKFAFYPAAHCYTGGTRENELILILS